MEEWRIIPSIGFPYMASNLGRIKRAERTILYSDGTPRHDKEKILSQCFNKRTGRYYVAIRQHGRCPKNYLVHRLIAEAFCENDSPETRTTVNHIDGNPANNKADNLEWVSYGDNLKHAYDVLGRPHNASSIRKRKCKITNLATCEDFLCQSVAEGSRKTGLSETQLRRIAEGECCNALFEVQYA